MQKNALSLSGLRISGNIIKMAIILGVSIIQGIFRHDFSETGTVQV